MSLPIIVRPAAEQDIRKAVDWYENQSPGLGSEFVRCLDACLSLISRHPEMFPEVHRKSRMALLRRFPYLVLYRPSAECISVIAVVHASRHPRQWKNRGEV